MALQRLHQIQVVAFDRLHSDPGNDAHVAAPMPGLVVYVSVQPGQAVQRGDTLLTIEAMKMETAVTADRDGTVGRVLAQAGTTVEAKDLLLTIDDG